MEIPRFWGTTGSRMQLVLRYTLKILALATLLTCGHWGYLYGQDTLRIYQEPSIDQGNFVREVKENRDVNGRLGAGLKIVTDLSALSFGSNNGIIRTENREGEYYLLLQPDERVVRIYKEGFVPFTLILADEGIDLQSKQIWEIGITGDQDLQMLPVNIVTEPEDTFVNIDGERQDSTLSIPLATGEHVVQIQRRGYATIMDTISVSPQQTLFQYQMEEVDPVNLELTSSPDSATVYLNNVPLGTTPVDTTWSPGDYQLRIERENYRRLDDRITLAEGEQNTFDYTMPGLDDGTLLLDVTPNSADVYLNNQPYEHDSPIYLDPGTWQMRVEQETYEPYTTSLDIISRDTLNQTVGLEPIVGSLQVNVDPDYANLRLEREGNVVETWMGDSTITDLRVGSYHLSATTEGTSPEGTDESDNLGIVDYLPQTRNFEITDGGQQQFDITLLPEDGGNLTLLGVPGQAEVTLQGINRLSGGQVTRAYEELPAVQTNLPYGSYTVEIRKKGFSPLEAQFNFNSRSREVNLVDRFDPKSKAGSVIWSLFVPGGGQFHMGKTGRGVLFLLAGGAAAGYTVKSILDFQSQVNEYETALETYNNATRDFDNLWENVQTSYQAKEDLKQQIKYGIYAFAGVRLIELLDNLLFPSPKNKLEEARLKFQSNGSSMSMRYNF